LTKNFKFFENYQFINNFSEIPHRINTKEAIHRHRWHIAEKSMIKKISLKASREKKTHEL
jgi:hypothetical protein